MAHEVICRSCGHAFRTEDSAGRMVSACPRCDTPLPRAQPGAAIRTEGPAPRTEPPPRPPARDAIRPVGPPGPRTALYRCPACDRAVAEHYRFCPYCEEPLEDLADQAMRATPEDVKGGGPVAGIGMILLTLAAGALTVAAMVMVGAGVAAGGGLDPVAALFLAISLTAALTLCILLLVRARKPNPKRTAPFLMPAMVAILVLIGLMYAGMIFVPFMIEAFLRGKL